MNEAAIVALILLGLLSLFQLALILGAPLGNFAWGGQHKVLPRKLRTGSIISIVTYAFFAACIMSKSGIWQIIPQGKFLDISLWIIFGYLTIGIFMNAISRSKPERYTMTPVVILLTACVYVVASN